MRKLLLLGLALLAAYMGGRALRRNAEVVQLLWALVGMTALTGTAGTAKSRSTEDRLSALIPKVFPNTGGTISGPVTVNGSHTVNGNMSVSGSHTVGGQVNAAAVASSGAMSSFGFTSHGGLSADGTLNASNFSGTFSGSHSGSYAGGQSRPGGYPISHGTPWEDQVIDVINNIANVLVNAHVTN